MQGKHGLSEIAGRNVYILQDARKLTRANGSKVIEDGVEFLSYGRTYGRGPSGYEGRPYALTMGTRRFSQMARMIPNR